MEAHPPMSVMISAMKSAMAAALFRREGNVANPSSATDATKYALQLASSASGGLFEW